jgi:hypothetical protein
MRIEPSVSCRGSGRRFATPVPAFREIQLSLWSGCAGACKYAPFDLTAVYWIRNELTGGSVKTRSKV